MQRLLEMEAEMKSLAINNSSWDNQHESSHVPTDMQRTNHRSRSCRSRHTSRPEM